jgi:hypothetical protein
MQYRALNVFEARNQIVVEYEIIPGPIMAMLGVKPTRTMARGQGRKWVEERAQSLTGITELRLTGKVVDFLEKTAEAFKQLPAEAKT